MDLARHPKALAARIRAELHLLVRALAAGRFEDAAGCVRQDPDDVWDAARFEAALAPFLAEYGRIVFDGRARLADQTLIKTVAHAPLRRAPEAARPGGRRLLASSSATSISKARRRPKDRCCGCGGSGADAYHARRWRDRAARCGWLWAAIVALLALDAVALALCCRRVADPLVRGGGLGRPARARPARAGRRRRDLRAARDAGAARPAQRRARPEHRERTRCGSAACSSRSGRSRS